MKIYRVSYRDEHHEHNGYGYVTNKRGAEKECREHELGYQVEEFNIKLNKTDIMSFLNAHCSYPNNG